jgi:hypothetical protein
MPLCGRTITFEDRNMKKLNISRALRAALIETGRGGDHPPCDHNSRQPNPGADLIQDKVARHLGNEVTKEE